MKLQKWSEVKKESRNEERLAELKCEAAAELVRFRLNELRQRLEMTQVELARVSGMSQPQISKLESSHDALLSTLQRYADAIGGRLEINIVVDGETFEIAFEEQPPKSR